MPPSFNHHTSWHSRLARLQRQRMKQVPMATYAGGATTNPEWQTAPAPATFQKTFNQNKNEKIKL